MNTANDMVEPSQSDDLDDNLSDRWHDRHTHRIGPLILLSLSIAFVLAGSQLDFGSISRPGPGLWPIAIGTITGAMSLVSAVLPRKEEETFQRAEVARAATLMIAFFLFPTIFEYVGFVIPSILLITFMMKFLSRESWVKSLIVAVATTAIAYVLFGVMLNVRLPAFTLSF